jgi:hypothetical protein
MKSRVPAKYACKPNARFTHCIVRGCNDQCVMYQLGLMPPHYPVPVPWWLAETYTFARNGDFLAANAYQASFYYE